MRAFAKLLSELLRHIENVDVVTEKNIDDKKYMIIIKYLRVANLKISITKEK